MNTIFYNKFLETVNKISSLKEIKIIEIFYRMPLEKPALILNKKVLSELPEPILNFMKEKASEVGCIYYVDREVNGSLNRGHFVFSVHLVRAAEERKNQWISKIGERYGENWMEISKSGYAFYAVDDGNLLMLGTVGENKGKVLCFSHEGMYNHGKVLANSFDEFIEELLANNFAIKA